MKEAKKRDYKAEYKKFQSSTKSKKYRAELNKYNRKKGTYGNGDGKDASHKGGKIVGFESQSKNRGRAEKSRLKQESLIYEIPASVFSAAAAVKLKNKAGKEVSAATAAKSDYAKKDPATHKKAKSIFQRLKDKFSKKKDDKKPAPKKQSKSDTDFYKRQFAGESVNESRANVVKAIAIAKKMGGNMTGAVKKIEKIQKGLSKQIEVEDALKQANESVNEAGTKSIDGEELLKYLQKRFKMSRKQAIASMKKHNMDVSSIKKESVDEARSKTITAIGSIIGKRQAQKIGGVLVDMQTALVIMKVWNALGASNRSKFEKLPIKQMANVAWKLVK